MTFSIIIPTYNKIDLLKSCIESIQRNTDLSNGEVIVVCNGCTDGSKEYVQSLGHPYKLLYWDEPLGYTKAANIGLCVCKSEIAIMMNNDCQILDWGKNVWVPQLLEPFEDPKVAVTGPYVSWRGYRPWVMFAIAAIRRNIISKVGLLDESFSPGAGEDTDFCLRVQNHGYLVVSVPQPQTVYAVEYPVWHIGSLSMMDIPQVADVYKRNEQILRDRYGSKTG